MESALSRRSRQPWGRGVVGCRGPQDEGSVSTFSAMAARCASFCRSRCAEQPTMQGWAEGTKPLQRLLPSSRTPSWRSRTTSEQDCVGVGRATPCLNPTPLGSLGSWGPSQPGLLLSGVWVGAQLFFPGVNLTDRLSSVSPLPCRNPLN